jgi:zinc D-Ala-D-Ala carboxypeptidase
MEHNATARAARGVSRFVLGGLAVIVALSIGTLGHPSLSSSETSVFDDTAPSVVNLDPKLREALREAAADARRDGVEIHVNSGWRSPAEQERLLQKAISTYGSREAAARWVATPSTSPHVSGDAVDLGPTGATAWLSAHGADHGLCQIYGNEPWHYELRPEAVDHGCPPTYADPTRDPRMHP